MFSHKFQKKRSYQKYYADRELVTEILKYFAENEGKTYSLTQLSQETGIPLYQISKWKIEWEKDHTFVPGSNFGRHKRVFTETEEKNISDFIRAQYIKTGIMVRRKHLKKILYDLWVSLKPEERQNQPQRLFSNHFVRNFCKRNGFSFRMMRKKKRSDISEQEVEEYMNKYAEAFHKYPWNRILNADETAWNYVYFRGCVLAEVGKEEVAAQLPDDYRKAFTVLATIGADGTKYPPLFFAKGKTSISFQQFKDMNADPTSYELVFSEGGNTDEQVMMKYLEMVHRWVNSEPCVLILDRYSAHTMESVIAKAAELHIELIFIPTSATDKYQPLDKRIFGILKSMAAKDFSDYVFHRNSGFTKAEAADLFVDCWKKLSIDAVLTSWRLCENEEEDKIDEEFTVSSSNEYEEEEDIGELDDDDLSVITENRIPRRSANPLTPRPFHH